MARDRRDGGSITVAATPPVAGGRRAGGGADRHRAAQRVAAGKTARTPAGPRQRGGECAVPARDRHHAGRSHQRRQCGGGFPEWRADLSGHAGRDPRRPPQRQHGNLHLLVGRGVETLRRRADRTRARRGEGARAGRLGGLGAHETGGDRRAARRRRALRVFPSAALVLAGPRQQPHPPQAADRGRPGGVQRRGGHRRCVGGQRPAAGPLARHAVPGGGPGGGADAGDLLAKLARHDRRGLAGHGLLPGTCPPRRAGCAGVRQLARWRQREHAADVPDGDRRRTPLHRPGGGVLRARRAHPSPRCATR